MRTIVLDQRRIKQKIVRMAYEIIENLFETETIHVIGIAGNGVQLAQYLVDEMRNISGQNVQLNFIQVDKDNPLAHAIHFNEAQLDLKKAHVVLVDDVINSGKTIQYALNHILTQPVHQVKTATLVDRKHRRFPIHADFVGIQLSTTMQERVEVSFEGEWKAFLV
jgi:pyrimidine operon attenuation protein / uracil phosphoribosyltransferase